MKKESSLENLAKDIIDSMEDIPKEEIGSMGTALIGAFEDMKNKLDSKAFLSPKEIELMEKMKDLKIAENEGDLAWLDYDSWNGLRQEFRDLLVAIVKPLFWGGVFFRYKLFLEYDIQLCTQLSSDGGLLILTQGRNFKMSWVGADSSQYNHVNYFNFNTLLRDYRSNQIKSYGRSRDKVIVKNKVKVDKKSHFETLLFQV